MPGCGNTRRVSGALNPPVLSGAFRTMDENDSVKRAGYRFRIFLPGRDGDTVAETRDGLAGGATDPDAAELRWSVYAWPMHPNAGHRTFFVDERGDVYATTDPRYPGGSGPEADAALTAPAGADPLPPLEHRGRDGNVWRLVN